MRGGSEWIIDAEGCEPDKLSQLSTMQQVCERVVEDLDLRVLGEPQWHQFPDPGGVTGMYLLSESHLTCHTFPESGFATFNLFCCRPKPDWNWEQTLHSILGARSVVLRCIERVASDGESLKHEPAAASEERTPRNKALGDETVAEAIGSGEMVADARATADVDSLNRAQLGSRGGEACR